jgi:glycosyltransferase involved in cell wall biosynthesis
MWYTSNRYCRWGIPEQIKHGETGFLVPPGDSEAMAIKTLRLLDNKYLLTQMSINARKDSQSCFDFNHQADEYLLWYLEFISKRKKRHISI